MQTLRRKRFQARTRPRKKADICTGSQQTYKWQGGDRNVRRFSINGDNANRITQQLWASLSRTDPATGSTSTTTSSTPITWSAGYDNRNRLTSFGRNSTSSHYSYDANSNRLTSVDIRTSDTDLDGDFDQADLTQTTAQALNVDTGSNRLLGFTQTLSSIKNGKAKASSSSQVSYSLDANGNLTSDGARSFVYDSANRLSQVQLTQNGEAAKISYLHNALGQRVFKSEPQMAHSAPSETELGFSFIEWLKKFFGWLFGLAQSNATLGQSYLYDDASLGHTPSLLGEYGNGGARSKGRIEYLWLPTEDGQSLPIGLYRNGRLYAIHADHLNTPRLITDDAQKVVWQWSYSAFGDNKPTGILKATTNPRAAVTNQPVMLRATVPALEVNLRFAGQYFDEESNLSYNLNRSYQATQGRYTQSDPIGLAGGLNTFSYVGGNPLMDVDPEGLQGRGNVTPGGPGANLRWPSMGTVAPQTQQHHSGPVFLGFPRSQELTPLTRNVHEQLHRDLNNFLRTQTSDVGQHMRPQSNNSGRDIRENFSAAERWNALREFYNRYGDQYPWAARDFFRQFPDQNFCGR